MQMCLRGRAPRHFRVTTCRLAVALINLIILFGELVDEELVFNLLSLFNELVDIELLIRRMLDRGQNLEFFCYFNVNVKCGLRDLRVELRQILLCFKRGLRNLSLS
jgi:ferredoxin-fold anticodon binding domain-containing protein